MKILVTGGAGFIGSHLCKFLLDKGYYVICLDNFFTGRKKNIISLLNNPCFELIRHDIVNPIGVRSCYDEGKRIAECLCMDYNRMNKVDVRIIRIFNTYGPNMDPNDGRVISNFIMQALNGKDITIYGDGLQTRSFQYVSDLIDGMYKMMNQEEFIGPVNIGNPSEFTIKELAEKVIKLTGSKSKIIYKPLPSDDPKQRQPDITLAKQKLNWSPKISLDEGLIDTVNYFKKELEEINKN